MTIRAVCFDFQDTLAYFERSHLDIYVQAAVDHGLAVSAGAMDMPTEEAWGPWQTAEGPDHSDAKDEAAFREVRVAVHRRRLEAAEIDGAIADAIARRIEQSESDPRHYRLFDDVVPALDRLARSQVAALIVSNHIWRLPEIVRALGLSARLEGVLTSARVGYRKPHPEIYAAPLRLLDCPPSEVLFIGDSRSHDVDAPRREGMQALLLDRDGTDGGDDTIRTLMEIPLDKSSSG